MVEPAPHKLFFVAGGTVPPESPSYVERAADRELYEALLSGAYCYVLNSRQMGKSSLAVRTIARLNAAGVRTAFVDLTRIGGATTTPDQWYAGLLIEAGRALGLRTEAAGWLKEHREVGPAQRFFSFLHEAVLLRIEAPVVLMLDEIDAVRSLPFATDELFAGLRQLHNGRASDASLERLTVCLLGAALPSDLIRDPRVTPFNVGRRVELRDFTPEEASPFARVIGKERLEEVLRWTGGHPFLTQALCAEIEDRGDVEALVRARYLDARARDSDTNLTDVGRRLLGTGDPNFGEKERADVLSLYDRLLHGKPVADDEANPSAARIKMSGAARLENGLLKPRNEIYRQVFDHRWVRENMPGQELRRQRKAFWRGVVRTSLAAGLILAVVTGLAFIALRNERRAIRAEALAKSERDKARYDAYVATMRNMASLADQRNLQGIAEALSRLKDDPARGWEWDYWHRLANHRERRIDMKGRLNVATSTPDGRWVVTQSPDGMALANTGQAKAEMLDIEADTVNTFSIDPTGRKIYLFDEGFRVREYDRESRRVLREEVVPGLEGSWDIRSVAPDGRSMFVRMTEGRVGVLDLRSFTLRPASPMPPYSQWIVASPDRRFVHLLQRGKSLYPRYLSIVDARDWTEKGRVDAKEPVSGGMVSHDGRYGVIGTATGVAILYDALTGRVLWRRKMMESTITSPDFSPNGKLLFLGGRARQAIVFPFDEKGPGPILRRIPEASGGGFLPDSRHVYTLYWNIDVHDLNAEEAVPERRLGDGFSSGRIDANGTLVGSDGQGSFLLDLRSPMARRVPIATPLFAGLEESARYYFSRRDKACTITEIKTGRQFVSIPTTAPYPWRVAVSSDEKTLALATERDIDIFDVPSRQRIGRAHRSRQITSMRFTQDSHLLAETAGNGRITMWPRTGGKPVWDEQINRVSGNGFELSTDNSQILEFGHDDRGHIVETKTGRKLATLVGHSQSVIAGNWSPDASRVVTGSDDGTVRLWDAATGAELGILGRHGIGIVSVRYLPGGRTIASVSGDGVVKLWMTESRR